jgi:hypothetical protein
MAEAMEEFVAHRDKYNPGWGWFPPDNRGDITNKFNNAKNWVKGRPENFFKHIKSQWRLYDPNKLTINKANEDVEITFNGIKLSKKTFNGKFFSGHTITLSGKAPEGKTIIGWKETGVEEIEYDGETVSIMMPACSLDISPILADATGIENVDVSTVTSTPSALYDLMGNKVKTPQAGKIYIQNGKKILWR